MERLAPGQIAPENRAIAVRNISLTKSETWDTNIPSDGIDAPGRRPGKERRMKNGFETFCPQPETSADFPI
jgi:hypothetical protein